MSRKMIVVLGAAFIAGGGMAYFFLSNSQHSLTAMVIWLVFNGAALLSLATDRPKGVVDKKLVLTAALALWAVLIVAGHETYIEETYVAILIFAARAFESALGLSKQPYDMNRDQSHRFCYEFARPSLAADCVLLAETATGLSVLLIRRAHEPFSGAWALPGGHLDPGETIEDAAERELREETHVKMPFGAQLVGVYSKPGRDPRGWTISVAYAVITSEAILAGAVADDDADCAAAWPLSGLPALAFDHAQIIADAVTLLESGADQVPVVQVEVAVRLPKRSL